jgi:uncharacterized integral membrane protein
MAYLYMALNALFVALILLFSVQNLGNVTITLFTFSARLPLALLVVLVYLLGMSTGGYLLALLRSSVKGARRGAR